MKDQIITYFAGVVVGAVICCISDEPPKQASITVPREEVIEISATPAVVQGGDDTPDVVMSATAAEAHEAADPSAVSFESNYPETPDSSPEVTFNCPTCKGAGIFHGALCPTCDGAAAATLTKDGVTFSEQGFKPQQAAPTAPTGRWLTVPTYGRFGRQRGYQRVWQAYGKQQYYAPTCAGGRCR